MARRLLFEPFDAEPPPPEPAGPSEDWHAGYAQGQADAAADAATRRAERVDAALAAIGDLSFMWVEARSAVLTALVPFFRVLAERLLPELAAGSFPLHLVEELARAAGTDAAPSATLHLSPEDAAAVTPLLSAAGLGGVTLVPDAALAPGQARLGRGAGSTALDAPALVAALQDVVAAFLAAAEGGPTTDGADLAPDMQTPEPEGQLAHG